MAEGRVHRVGGEAFEPPCRDAAGDFAKQRSARRMGRRMSGCWISSGMPRAPRAEADAALFIVLNTTQRGDAAGQTGCANATNSGNSSTANKKLLIYCAAKNAVGFPLQPWRRNSLQSGTAAIHPLGDAPSY